MGPVWAVVSDPGSCFREEAGTGVRCPSAGGAGAGPVPVTRGPCPEGAGGPGSVPSSAGGSETGGGSVSGGGAVLAGGPASAGSSGSPASGSLPDRGSPGGRLTSASFGGVCPGSDSIGSQWRLIARAPAYALVAKCNFRRILESCGRWRGKWRRAVVGVAGHGAGGTVCTRSQPVGGIPRPLGGTARGVGGQRVAGALKISGVRRRSRVRRMRRPTPPMAAGGDHLGGDDAHGCRCRPRRHRSRSEPINGPTG
jgi:hypothetical protein